MSDTLALARSVELGPRPPVAVHGVVHLTAAELHSLLDGDRAVPTDGLPTAWAGALAALAQGLRSRWWLGPLEVLDGGDGGLWLLAVGSDDAVLTPTSSRAVWRLLCASATTAAAA